MPAFHKQLVFPVHTASSLTGFPAISQLHQTPNSPKLSMFSGSIDFIVFGHVILIGDTGNGPFGVVASSSAMLYAYGTLQFLVLAARII